jgi:hypothetical protein
MGVWETNCCKDNRGNKSSEHSRRSLLIDGTSQFFVNHGSMRLQLAEADTIHFLWILRCKDIVGHLLPSNTSITRQRFKQIRTWVLLTCHLSVSGLNNTLCYPWWNHSCNMSQMIINHKILWHINLVQCLARRWIFLESNLYNLSCISIEWSQWSEKPTIKMVEQGNILIFS